MGGDPKLAGTTSFWTDRPCLCLLLTITKVNYMLRPFVRMYDNCNEGRYMLIASRAPPPSPPPGGGGNFMLEVYDFLKVY